MKKNIQVDKDITTEEKIKTAALKLFQKRGYAGTKTRDIAEEAGINIALLNYYFRSKEKLFEIIMEESLHKLFVGIRGIFDEQDMTFDQKLERLVSNYIDALIDNPELPLFVLSEMQSNVTGLLEKAAIPKRFVLNEFANNGTFLKQLHKELHTENPMQIILNIISLSVFPFAAKPMWTFVTKTSPDDFTKLMEERKKLIPKWIKSMI